MPPHVLLCVLLFLSCKSLVSVQLSTTFSVVCVLLLLLLSRMTLYNLHYRLCHISVMHPQTIQSTHIILSRQQWDMTNNVKKIKRYKTKRSFTYFWHIIFPAGPLIMTRLCCWWFLEHVERVVNNVKLPVSFNIKSLASKTLICFVDIYRLVRVL